MFYALSIVTCFLIITAFVSWEFKKPAHFNKHYSWLVAQFIVVVSAVAVSFIMGDQNGNFIQHMMGGGFAVGLGFYYLLSQFKPRFSWRIELFVLLGLVSLLGNINEIIEFIADSFGFGIYSFNRTDTWRDIVANTFGALLCFALVKIYRRFICKNKV